MEHESTDFSKSSIGPVFDLNIPSTSSQMLDIVMPETGPVPGISSGVISVFNGDVQSKVSVGDSSSDGDSEKEDALEYTQLGGFHEGKTDKKYEKEYIITRLISGELTFSEYAATIDLADDDIVNNILTQNSVENESVATPMDVKPEIKPAVTKKSKKKYIRRHLPPALKGLMGEANIRYVRGDKETAVKICLEIIRQVPTAPEPYQTLADLYGESCPDKSLQMSLIAAHLSPGDANQWIHLGEVSHEQGNIKQAIMCYTKALKADEKNIDVHFKRAELLEKEGQKGIALKGFSKLLTILDPAVQGDKILELSKLLAEMYHKEKDLFKTRETLEVAFKKCPSLVTSEHVNLLLEVLLSMKDYSSCLEILIQFCDVSVEIETNENGSMIIDCCQTPANMAIDLKVKLIVTLIHLKSLNPLVDLLKSLESANVNDVGDLYLDVAEAFMAEEYYEKALPLFSSLVASKCYNLPAVWLHFAECLKNLGHIEKAIDAYLKVLEQAPQHNDARLVVSQLLTKVGRRDEAINVLVQDEKCELLNPDILYEKCMLLKDKVDQADEFLAVGQLFLSRHFVQIKKFEELRTLCNYRGSSAYKKKAALKELHSAMGDVAGSDKPQFSEGKNMPTVEEEWDLYMHMCTLCLKLRKFTLLQRLTFSAQASDIFATYLNEINILCLMSSFFNNDAYLGFNYARQIVLKDINLSRPWNLFNLVVIKGDDSRHNKFIMRLLSRNPSNRILALLHANNCLVSGTYKYALNEYVSAYRKEKCPMLAFLIGVTLIQMACQKFSAKKHSLVSQAIAFFSKYYELRGADCSQEYHYNLGRVYHQLGLLPSALHHYKKALESKQAFINGNSDNFDLSREAAYNVHLIYMQSGAFDMARMYLEKYIIV